MRTSEIRMKASVGDGITASANDGKSLVRCVEYCPGNGARYVLVIVGLFDRGSEFDAFGKRQGWPEIGYVVTLWPGLREKSAAMIVADQPGSVLHFRYIAEKLNVSIVDAVALAEIIADMTGRESISAAQAADMITDGE